MEKLNFGGSYGAWRHLRKQKLPAAIGCSPIFRRNIAYWERTGKLKGAEILKH
jgi:hypothetical protein